jgi:hypothetical protein
MVAIQSMGEARGRCPCFLWQLSQLHVVYCKWRQGQQQNMVDLRSSGLGNSKHNASPSYHMQWFELSIDLCATWVWHSLRRTGLSSSHCGASAVMNSGFTLNTQCHGLIIDTQPGMRLYRVPVTCWSDITCSLAIRVHWPRKECWTKLPWVSWVIWCSYFYEFWHKALFLSRKSIQHEIICDLMSEFQVFIL